MRRSQRNILVGLVVALLGASTPATADGPDIVPPCEPLVIGVTIDFSTFPPSLHPTIAIRPECLP